MHESFCNQGLNLNYKGITCIWHIGLLAVCDDMLKASPSLHISCATRRKVALLDRAGLWG
nr:MAG TPA: hypothetical protein [Bacteriophage sp.]